MKGQTYLFSPSRKGKSQIMWPKHLGLSSKTKTISSRLKVEYQEESYLSKEEEISYEN